ncbi:hypothetical protein ACFSC4_26200 [Deinococcus malanensis]|uniref:hypothetical protein n=1 Tax=Deinococcus malanensis TaxID=1706855 RepID=UPI00362A965D
MTPRNSALTLKQQLDRLTNRLHELAGWRDHAQLPIQEVKFSDVTGKTSTLAVGQGWPSRAFPVSLTFSISIPPEWAGQCVMLHADPGARRWSSSTGVPSADSIPFTVTTCC